VDKGNRSTLLFIALALGLSYLYWGLFYLHEQNWVAFDPSSDLMGAIRGYGPSIAAIIAAAVIYGRQGLNSLWMRVKMWRIPLWLFALAIFGPVLFNLVLVFIAFLSGVDLALNPESVPLPKLILIFFFFAIVDGPIGEEIGWRGFLLPRLLEKHGAIFPSVLIGIVWFVWHMPLYIATERFDMSLAFLLSYLLNNIAFSFLHTWFFLRSGGSVLLSIIFHTAGNYFVFLSITLFPGIEQWPIAEQIYAGVLVFAAVFAGVSIWRNPALHTNHDDDAVNPTV
jgi:uncharacterized protein